MKKTQVKELFSNIKRTFIPFASLTMFIFLGIGIFQGFNFTGKAITEATNTDFTKLNGNDFSIYYPYGVTKKEINSLRKFDGADQAEGKFVSFNTYLNSNNEKKCIKVESLTEKIDICRLEKGRMPLANNELVILNGSEKRLNLTVGDSITFSECETGIYNYLANYIRTVDYDQLIEFSTDDIKTNDLLESTFTIVGVVTNPFYLSDSLPGYGESYITSSQVDGIFFTRYESFDPAVTGGYYNTAVLKSTELSKIKPSSKEYKTRLMNLRDDIDNPAQDLAVKSYEKVYNNAEKLVNEVLKDNDEYIGYVKENKLLPKYITKLPATIITRTDNAIYIYDNLLSGIVNKLSYSLGGLFLAISFLVCYSVLSRIVHDQIIQIGTKKALGISQREITSHYLGYTFISTIIGGLLGNGLAILLEKLLIPKITTAFSFAKITNFVSPWMVVGLFFGELLILELISYFACKSVFKRSATKLLQGEVVSKSKPRFYEKGKLWNRLSLVSKSSINNLVNDKRRVIATIVGVMGITSILISSITMRNNVNVAAAEQFRTIYKFDTFVYFDNSVSSNYDTVETYLKDKQVNYCPFYRVFANFNINYGEDKFTDQALSYVMVFKDADAFSKMNGIVSVDKEPFDYHGIWIPESYQKAYGLKTGETISFKTRDGKEGISTVDKYFTSYSYMVNCFMDETTYRNTFLIDDEEEVKANMFLVDFEGFDKDIISDEVKHLEPVTYYLDYESYVNLDAKVFTEVADILVGAYLLVGILMAIFVILNLLMTFIAEKKNQLIVMMINGYSRRRVNKYIYNDTILLSFIGIALGVFVGNLFGDFAISAFESKFMYLMHMPNIWAILIGVGITALLIFIMSIISLKSIKKFKLTNIDR